MERVNFCQDLPLTKKEPNWKKKKKERKRKKKSPAISVLLIESKFIQWLSLRNCAWLSAIFKADQYHQNCSNWLNFLAGFQRWMSTTDWHWHSSLGFSFHSSLFVASSLDLWGWWHVWSDCHLLSGSPTEDMGDFFHPHCQTGGWDHVGCTVLVHGSRTLLDNQIPNPPLSHQCTLWGLAVCCFVERKA